MSMTIVHKHALQLYVVWKKEKCKARGKWMETLVAWVSSKLLCMKCNLSGYLFYAFFSLSLFFHETSTNTRHRMDVKAKHRRIKKYLPSTNKRNENEMWEKLKDPISDIRVDKRIALHTRASRGTQQSAIMMVQ